MDSWMTAHYHQPSTPDQQLLARDSHAPLHKGEGNLQAEKHGRPKQPNRHFPHLSHYLRQEAKTVSLSSGILRQILDKAMKTRFKKKMSNPIQANAKKADPRKVISNSTLNQVRITSL
ncbi:hypothetical protein Taro_034088 [Colocasia esculenta]|uniref:Uncharacterized protein n=1 Tax=Colocasia esculenta TaxID=4460 RepID=A0A843W343_COLES|nr:hypothetical protein [Colocasia esculenta]